MCRPKGWPVQRPIPADASACPRLKVGEGSDPRFVLTDGAANWICRRSTCRDVVTITKRPVAVPPGAVCFGCNQSFQGNPVGVQFHSDLVPPIDRAELAGLYFHPGHLIRYARRRDWAELASFIEANGVTNY